MPLAIGMPGLPEMVVILLILLMLFGVGKLPQVLSQMGKGVKAFKDGMREGDDSVREVRATLAEAEEIPEREGVRTPSR